MCGEKFQTASTHSYHAQSPPHVRGKDFLAHLKILLVGITPACAGKSRTASCGNTGKRDHPRMCGEKTWGWYVPIWGSGSPPHVRGKADALGCCGLFSGITPACAGKSAVPRHRPAVHRDHPRACGEKNGENGLTFHQMGSPPRVRGKGVHIAHRQGCEGITPAHAGKRMAFLSATKRRWDHPRTCGEKKLNVPCEVHPTGSPPRMRGKDTGTMGFGGAERITPAYAGKSTVTSSGGLDDEDHPRVCGEKRGVRLPGGLGRGSPPRMRGKADAATHGFLTQGITPAYAGKSRSRKCTRAEHGDHPRMCGEKTRLKMFQKIKKGSPPHVRGKAAST